MTSTRQRNQIQQKRRKQLRILGIPGQIDSRPVADHLRVLINSGWQRIEIAAASGVSARSIQYILGGQPEVQTRTAQLLLAVKPYPLTLEALSVGAARRIRAMSREAWSIPYIARQVSRSAPYLYKILRGDATDLDRATAERIDEVYRRHAGRQGPFKNARASAAYKNWPGSVAWDDDTLDDPQACPNWTGFCGTDRGFWSHRLQKVPMCQPCEQAHAEWKAAHAHLSGADRIAAAHAARCAAANRGPELAEDGRELLRLGCSYDQAAARLGVTRQHLQQELCRHPETAAAA